MVRAERFLGDRQRPLEERPRPGELALRPKQLAEVVEAHRSTGMVASEGGERGAAEPRQEAGAGIRVWSTN